MSTRAFALIWGILFLAGGASGFVPGLWIPAPDHYPHLVVDSYYGDALGLFPVNILHNGVHILFGLWGLLAYRSAGAARTYAKAVAIIYIVLIIMGLVPALDTTFGYIPLFGKDVWLHLFLALPAAYFGWVNRDPVGA
ncbi:MAG TPA: DUF4383 domain-containing protein [Allosphingosinicella sp.]|nr:DUF4383 domain-containing protein [Allosphingosinicella sp.]